MCKIQSVPTKLLGSLHWNRTRDTLPTTVRGTRPTDTPVTTYSRRRLLRGSVGGDVRDRHLQLSALSDSPRSSGEEGLLRMCVNRNRLLTLLFTCDKDELPWISDQPPQKTSVSSFWYTAPGVIYTRVPCVLTPCTPPSSNETTPPSPPSPRSTSPLK